MFENLKFALNLVGEAIKKHGLSTLLHQQIFYKRVAVPGYFDLTRLETSKNPITELNYQFIELKQQDVLSGKWTFLAAHRRMAALRHFKQGLRGFALVNNHNLVIGDIWCLTSSEKKTPIKHPDLSMLGIDNTPHDAYALDMFLPPSQRGKNLAVPVHRALQLTLKQEGCLRLYAYFWQDNLPSRWMHWMLKFNQLPKMQISRFFFIKVIHLESDKHAPHLRIQMR